MARIISEFDEGVVMEHDLAHAFQKRNSMELVAAMKNRNRSQGSGVRSQRESRLHGVKGLLADEAWLS